MNKEDMKEGLRAVINILEAMWKDLHELNETPAPPTTETKKKTRVISKTVMERMARIKEYVESRQVTHRKDMETVLGIPLKHITVALKYLEEQRDVIIIKETNRRWHILKKGMEQLPTTTEQVFRLLAARPDHTLQIDFIKKQVLMMYDVTVDEILIAARMTGRIEITIDKQHARLTESGYSYAATHGWT